MSNYFSPVGGNNYKITSIEALTHKYYKYGISETNIHQGTLRIGFPIKTRISNKPDISIWNILLGIIN